MMAFIEINDALNQGLEGFKQFIQQKLEADKDYLRQVFWFQGGGQITVLNYLIHFHEEPQEGQETLNNFSDHIQFILGLTADKHTNEPLHKAVSSKKIELAIRLLDANKTTSYFNVDQRDAQGRTLLSLILQTKNVHLLSLILSQKPNVNNTTIRSNVTLPPLHEAVMLDFAEAINLLVKNGAQLSNEVGPKKETSVLLAARLGHINALRELLQFPADRLSLEAETIEQSGDDTHNAVEELCLRIAEDKNPEDALKGVAMLLCCGAKPPRTKELCSLLGNRRKELLEAIDSYLKDKPELVNPFVFRCHDKESALHNIIYANHSWGNSMRHLFGQPRDAALMIERLVSRAHGTGASGQIAIPSASSRLTTNSTSMDEGVQLYAEFVRRYKDAYDNHRFTNRWSTMRWMIAEGCADWGTVVNYSISNPSSRTRAILNEMFAAPPNAHENVNDEVPTHQSVSTPRA